MKNRRFPHTYVQARAVLTLHELQSTEINTAHVAAVVHVHPRSLRKILTYLETDGVIATEVNRRANLRKIVVTDKRRWRERFVAEARAMVSAANRAARALRGGSKRKTRKAVA